MKLFFTFLLSLSFLFSNVDKQYESEYQSALNLFNDHSYLQAFEAFEVLVDKKLDSLDFNFYYAQSAFVLKKVNLAIAAYERILIIDPYNNRTKLELGNIYFVLGKFDVSRQYFNEVLASRPPQQVKDNINVFINKIKNKDNLSSWSGMFQAGLVYDSNINAASEESNFFVPLLNLNLTNISLDEEDWAHHELLTLSHTLDTSKLWGFAIKNSFTFYNKTFDTYNAFDIKFINYSPSLSWKFDDLIVDIGLSRDVMWFGGDSLFDNYGYFSKFTYKSSPSSNYSLLLKSLARAYQSSANSSKDSHVQSFDFTYQSQLSQSWSIYLKELLQQERKDSGTDKTVDYDSFDTTLGFNYLSSSRTQWNFALSYKNLEYKDQDPFFLTTHIEDRTTATIGMTSPLSKTLALQAIVTGLQNDSTTATTRYERVTCMFNIMKKF